MQRARVIAVIGPGTPEDASVPQAAEACGRLVARAGATLVTGGLGGVMAAASRGARGEGGSVVAVLPGTDRAAATPHAQVAVCTGVGEARDLGVVASADAVIAVGGGWGTLAEIGLARTVGRPVVLLGSWGIADPHRPGQPDGTFRAETPEQAVALALEALP
ncbi:MAG: LOG family protein [Thermoleophilia bacterium]|nr:LOG family protein [Thermoleophilia bacterium]